MCKKWQFWLILALFFLSGLSALGYQVLWSKYLLRFIGVSAFSYAVVLSSFMAGLALGSPFFGRLSDRMLHPVKLYAWIEIGIGIYGIVFFLPLLDFFQSVVPMFFPLGEEGSLAGLAKIILSAALVMPPTFLMGGTLPAIVRHLTVSDSSAGRNVSLCYAVNAFGAVAGVLLMAFWLLPSFGMKTCLMIMGLSNALIGASALLLSGNEVEEEIPVPAETEGRVTVAGSAEIKNGVQNAVPAEVKDGAPVMIKSGKKLLSWQLTLLLFLIFVEGYLSFSYEIAWTRFFGVVIGSSTYSFSIMLAAFISGIALGSFLLVRFDDRLINPLYFFGWTQLLIAFLVLLPLPAYPEMFWIFRWISSFFSTTEGAFFVHEAVKMLFCFLFMLPVATLGGMAIPLVVKGLACTLAELGLTTGRVYAANTWGNVLGAALAGLWLLPALGMESLLRLSGILNGVLGLIVLLHFSPFPVLRRSRRAAPLHIAGLLFIVAGSLNFFPGYCNFDWELRWFALRNYRRGGPIKDYSRKTAWEMVKNDEVELFRDDPAAHLMVTSRAKGSIRNYYLLVNGKTDASTGVDMSTQLLTGHLPLLLHDNPKKALIIGLASGVTAGAALTHPLQKLDVVELLRFMPEAARFFNGVNNQPFTDKRFRMIAEDGRAWLKAEKTPYDVIISVPSNPWTAGTGSLFTVEFNREVAARLGDDGLFMQWLQAYEISDETMTIILAGFRDVFPYVYAFQISSDILLMGAKKPLFPDYERLRARMSVPGVAAQLESLRMDDLYSLLNLQIWSPSAVDIIAALVSARNTDDNLYVEYNAPIDLFTGASPKLTDQFDERIYPSERIFANDYIKKSGQKPDLKVQFADPRFANKHGEDFLLAHCFVYFHEHASFPPEMPSQFIFRHQPDPVQIAGMVDKRLKNGDYGLAGRYLSQYRTAVLLSAMFSETAFRFWQQKVEDWWRILPEDAEGGFGAFLSELRFSFLEMSGQKKEAIRLMFERMETDRKLSPMHTLWKICRLDSSNACEIALGLFLAEDEADQSLLNYQDLRRKSHSR